MAPRTLTKGNKDELEQIFALRRQGMTTVALGLLYNKDHSTIVYHCRKHGVVPLVPEKIKYIPPPKPVTKVGKYDHLFDSECINKGKRSYRDYLIEAGINPCILEEDDSFI